MSEGNRSSVGLLAGVAVASGIACVAAAALLTNIFERKQEGRTPFVRVVEINDDVEDPAEWGKNFPHHYDDYLRTADMEQTLYGGSEALPSLPSDADPRSFVSKSKLDTIPQLRRMWAGYAFAKDFRAARGHAYMLDDQMYTQRQEVGQPGTCIHCHASTYPAMRRLGDGDVFVGFDRLNGMTYFEAREHVAGPIACIDCHDPQTMALRITRPAFLTGIAAVKKLEGIEDYDVNEMATRQEMRSYVCGQCHVEYYFKGQSKTLTYPWSKGLKVEDAYAVFEESGFRDWTHAETGAPMLKAQHPEFEMWNQGIHARAGVACADCHMPYERVGATKISSHHVRSPLLDANLACGTCHKADSEELVARAEAIQVRHQTLADRTLTALVELIDDLAAAREAGVPDERLAEALAFQRKASFYVDYVEAENSSGFHAPQEAARILGESIDASRKGQLAVRDALEAASTRSAGNRGLASTALP